MAASRQRSTRLRARPASDPGVRARLSNAWKATLATLVALASVATGYAAVATLWQGNDGEDAVTTPRAAGVSTVHGFTELADAVHNEAGPLLQQAEPYRGVSTIATDRLSASVPDAWSERSEAPWLTDDGSQIGNSVVASADVDAFYEYSETPGVFLGTSDSVVGVEALLKGREIRRNGACSTGDIRPFVDTAFEGSFRVSTRCQPGSTVVLELAAQHKRTGATVLVVARLAADRDLAALRTVVETLEQPNAPASTNGNPEPGPTASQSGGMIPVDPTDLEPSPIPSEAFTPEAFTPGGFVPNQGPGGIGNVDATPAPAVG